MLVAVLCIALSHSEAGAEELEMINRPVNASGLTGLLVTTGPFVMPFKTIEVSVGSLSEQSSRPDSSLDQYPSLTVTGGVTENSELTVGWSLVQKNLTGAGKQRGTGIPRIAWKYALIPQTETSSFPAVALFLSAEGAGDNKDIDLNGIDHWGARIGIAAGREIAWGDRVIGVYGDGQLVVHDLNEGNARDRYGLLNAGVLLPISKYRNLQVVIEYTLATGIDRITPQGGDYSSLTYGLRLVTERFNLSVGNEFIRPKVEGFDNLSGIIAMMSAKL